MAPVGSWEAEVTREKLFLIFQLWVIYESLLNWTKAGKAWRKLLEDKKMQEDNGSLCVCHILFAFSMRVKVA